MRYSNYLFMFIFCLIPSTCFSFFEALTDFLFHKKTCSQLQSTKRETAIKNLKKKQIDTPLDPIVNYNLGITQYQEEAFESASNNFERAAAQSNHNPKLQAEASLNAGTAHHAHAASLYEKKELDQALVKIDQALAWYSRLFASEKNQAIVAQKQEHAEQLKKKIEEEKKNQDQEKNKDNKDNKDNNQQDKQDQENQQQNKNNDQQKQNQENTDQKDQQQNQDKQENKEKSDSKQDQSNNDQNKEDESLKDQNKNDSAKETEQNQEENQQQKNQESTAEEKEQEAKKAEESAAEEKSVDLEHEAQDQQKKETLQQKRMRALIESLDQQEGDIQKEYLKRKTAISSQPTARGQKTW